MDPLSALIGVVVLVIYFVPSMVAFHREHEQKIPILLLNIFLGWSLVGWVVAIVWASLRRKTVPARSSASLRDRMEAWHAEHDRTRQKK